MIKLTNVTKSFPGIFDPVLNSINLSLDPQDFCILIGANGSGKSTLMKVINGWYLPDSGEVITSGQISQVVQDINQGTISSMTLLENIVLSEMRHNKPKFSFYRRYQDTTISKIKSLGAGLEEYINKPLHTLSGGQRQMIATLMATNSGSQILLLDEHTSALDPQMQSTLIDYTAQSILKQALTAIMITHKMDDAIKYGNRLIMLHKGQIVLDVKGQEKTKLNIQELIALFHKYEDQDLLSERR